MKRIVLEANSTQAIPPDVEHRVEPIGSFRFSIDFFTADRSGPGETPDRAGMDTDTVTTRLFDVALEYPWPTKYPERVLRNEFWERWQGREEQLSADPKAISEFKASRASGNSGSTHVDAGQGVGRLTQVRTASDVVSEMCAGAVELLGSWASKGNSVERS
jgi:hypothetical protein